MRIRHLAQLTAAAFVVNILFAYVWFVDVLGGEAWPIPTISETWTYKPANFISRQVVISGAVSLSIIHLAIYFATKAAPSAGVLLVFALIANAALALVSAICMDDTSPECLGSIQLHDQVAVLYFILIDSWMYAMQWLEWSSVRQLALGTSILTKCIYYSPGTLDPVARYIGWRVPINVFVFSLGEFEWINVFCILTFILSFVRDRLGDVHVGILAPDPSVPLLRRTPLASVANVTLVLAALSLALITLGLALALDGSIARDGTVPEVSDLFTLPPGNSVAHLGGVVASTLLIIACFQLEHAYRRWTPGTARFALGTSLLGTASLSMAMCVSKLEDSELHIALVAVCLANFQAFMVLLVAPATLAQQPWGMRATLIPITAVSLVTKIRFVAWDLENLFAVGELVDIASIIAFFAALAVLDRAELNKYPFALYRIEQVSTKAAQDSSV